MTNYLGNIQNAFLELEKISPKKVECKISNSDTNENRYGVTLWNLKGKWYCSEKTLEDSIIGVIKKYYLYQQNNEKIIPATNNWKEVDFFLRIHRHLPDEICGGSAIFSPCNYRKDGRPINIENDYVDKLKQNPEFIKKEKEVEEAVKNGININLIS